MDENNIINYGNCLSGSDFEKWVRDYLETVGLKAERVGGSGDGGVDIVATAYKGESVYRFYIQCKYQNSPLGRNAIQEVFAGTYYARDYGKPVVITNNYASPNARIYAKELGVEIISRPEWEEIREALDSGEISNPNQPTGLMGVILAAATNDTEYLNYALQNGEDEVKAKNKQELKMQIISEFEEAKEYVKEAAILHAKAAQYQQKSLDIQKRALIRNITYD